MDYLPELEIALKHIAFFIPVFTVTCRILESPTMRTILMDLVKVLAVTSMLGMVRAMPAAGPEAQVRGALPTDCLQPAK